MAEVNVIPGEVLAAMTVDEARAITDRIKDAAEEMWSLLLTAHERKAWAALGYQSWEEYIGGEFNMSRRRSYQLLDQGRAIHAIAAAAGMEPPPTNSASVDVNRGSHIPLTEREAREIKPILPQVTAEIKERVTSLGPTPEPEAVKEVVREVVKETRTAMQNRPRPGRPVSSIPRAVSTALAAIDRARRDLTRLPLAQIAQQDEEVRRSWAANLSEQMEALASFRNHL
jgi:hypothetical protein